MPTDCSVSTVKKNYKIRINDCTLGFNFSNSLMGNNMIQSFGAFFFLQKSGVKAKISLSLMNWWEKCPEFLLLWVWSE